MKKYLGLIVIIFSCLTTVNLWFLSKPDYQSILSNPLTSASQIMALIGLVLMSFSLLLSTRLYFIEKIFGGIDNIYLIHKHLGSFALLFILNHPILLAVKAIPKFQIALMYIIPGRDFAYNLGIFSLFIMILAFIFIVFINLPYNVWKYSHKFLALSFLLASIHSLLIQSDIARSPILKSWMLIFIIMGIGAGLYVIFLYKYLGPRYRYVVANIERKLDILNIYLKPLLRKLNFSSGQFVYLSFNNQNVGGESHPFSISSAPTEDLLRISIKILGDHTLKFPQLKEGNKVSVYGAYGYFAKEFNNKTNANFIWIAGGIGVTPFLSMLRSEISKPSSNKITFFNTYRNKEEGVFDDEINDYCQKINNVKYITWNTSEKKRLTIEKIKQEVDNFNDCNIMICGTIAMMESIKKQAIEAGIKEDKVYFENFSFF